MARDRATCMRVAAAAAAVVAATVAVAPFDCHKRRNIAYGRFARVSEVTSTRYRVSAREGKTREDRGRRRGRRRGRKRKRMWPLIGRTGLGAISKFPRERRARARAHSLACAYSRENAIGFCAASARQARLRSRNWGGGELPRTVSIIIPITFEITRIGGDCNFRRKWRLQRELFSSRNIWVSAKRGRAETLRKFLRR